LTEKQDRPVYFKGVHIVFNYSSQKGFSLIELLMVLVIVGLLAVVAVPSLLKSRGAAEKGAAIANLRTIHNNQLTYMSQRGRYARMRELNIYFNNTLGTQIGTSTNARILRGPYYYQSNPTPTDASLRTQYQIYCYRIDGFFIDTWFIMGEDGIVNTIVP
jgi:prepilin-type N-terminal cleavage/methylation domain-containing protein